MLKGLCVSPRLGDASGPTRRALNLIVVGHRIVTEGGDRRRGHRSDLAENEPQPLMRGQAESSDPIQFKGLCSRRPAVAL